MLNVWGKLAWSRSPCTTKPWRVSVPTPSGLYWAIFRRSCCVPRKSAVSAKNLALQSFVNFTTQSNLQTSFPGLRSRHFDVRFETENYKTRYHKFFSKNLSILSCPRRPLHCKLSNEPTSVSPLPNKSPCETQKIKHFYFALCFYIHISFRSNYFKRK